MKQLHHEAGVQPALLGVAFLPGLQPNFFDLLQELGPIDKQVRNFFTALPGMNRYRVDSIPGPAGFTILEPEKTSDHRMLFLN